MNKNAAHNAVPFHKDPEKAIEFFFRKYYAELCRGVNRLLKDRSLSEDLVQEVFIKVWNKKDQLTFDERFIYYLKKACYHATLAHLSQTHLKDQLAETPERDGADTSLLSDELEVSVRTAINHLPEKTRLIFTLSRYEEMSYREIANQLSLSVKAVEKHMGKALRLLRESLKEHLILILLIFF